MPDFSMFRGDTVLFNLSVLTAVGGPYNLTGCKLWMTTKRNKSDQDSSAVFMLDSAAGNGITINNAVAGTATLEIPHGATDPVTGPSTLFYDIQLKDSSGRIFTISIGTITVNEDVTRSIV